jgi:hypothetical protein
MGDLHDDVFAISPDIRYVAAAHGQQVQMRSRPDLRNASVPGRPGCPAAMYRRPCRHPRRLAGTG